MIRHLRDSVVAKYEDEVRLPRLNIGFDDFKESWTYLYEEEQNPKGAHDTKGAPAEYVADLLPLVVRSSTPTITREEVGFASGYRLRVARSRDDEECGGDRKTNVENNPVDEDIATEKNWLFLEDS
jgi:hypothetical protein